MDSTRRPACSVRCPANCIRLLITVRILRRCIFFRPGASFFFNDSCPIKDAYVFRCIVAGIQPDEQWFFRQLSAQFNGLSQEIRNFFLAVLFPNPQFKIDEVSFRADICHNWCISVKTLVDTGYAFLIGFRIVKGGYINIDRNKAVIQGCRLYVHFTQHVDICLLDVFAQG